MKKFIHLIMTMALLTSCASTEKMLENGDYEGLVALATRKLAGKKRKTLMSQRLNWVLRNSLKIKWQK